VLFAVNVSTLLPVLVVDGLNTAVTPTGRLRACSSTAPLNPFAGVMVIVLVAVLLRVMLMMGVEVVTVKLAAPPTVNATAVVCVKLPETPVMITVAVPAAAVLETVSVSVLVAVVLAGLNDAVTPLGNPLAERLTAPAKPLLGDTVIVLLPVAPCLMLKLLATADSAKSAAAAAVTVSVTVAVCVRLPETPLTVTVATPTAALLEAVSVSVLDPVVLAGLNDAVTPLGRPFAERLTALLKPLMGITVTVLLPPAPCTTLRLLGEADSE
jgi:hypothetical protein